MLDRENGIYKGCNKRILKRHQLPTEMWRRGSGPTISVYCHPHQGQVKMGFPPASVDGDLLDANDRNGRSADPRLVNDVQTAMLDKERQLIGIVHGQGNRLAAIDGSSVGARAYIIGNGVITGSGIDHNSVISQPWAYPYAFIPPAPPSWRI